MCLVDEARDMILHLMPVTWFYLTPASTCINSGDTCPSIWQSRCLYSAMYSQFWPKGGFPGILHHYVRFKSSRPPFSFLSVTNKVPLHVRCRRRLSSRLSLLPAPSVNLTAFSLLEVWETALQRHPMWLMSYARYSQRNGRFSR
jgi:hypothetical protein